MRRLAGLLVVAAALGATVAEAGTARDPATVREFRKSHPCPATGKTTGACAGWVVDHIIPLALYGADDPSNMQWQEAGAAKAKDRLEYDAYLRLKKVTDQCPSK